MPTFSKIVKSQDDVYCDIPYNISITSGQVDAYGRDQCDCNNYRNFYLCRAVSINMGMQRDHTVDDADLAKTCRNGDLSAFECLVERHQMMLITCVAIVSNFGFDFPSPDFVIPRLTRTKEVSFTASETIAVVAAHVKKGRSKINIGCLQIVSTNVNFINLKDISYQIFLLFCFFPLFMLFLCFHSFFFSYPYQY